MEPLSLASLGIGIGSSILGGVLGFGQADQMRKETEESIRRFKLIKDRTTSEADAMAGASGITSDSGSLTKYLADMHSEFGKEIDWMREAGNARADAMDMSSAFSSIGGIGSNLFSFGASNNWFRTPSIK